MAGSEQSLAATWGGAGFAERQGDHRDDLIAGAIWRRCGTRSEVAPLREVALSWPSDSIREIDDIDAALFLDRVDLDELRRETEQAVAAFESLGVAVRLELSDRSAPPNFLFLRDLWFMTEVGAVLARPAAQVRAREPSFAARALARWRVPILRTPTGSATLEGADALWIGRDEVLIGVGRRTNAAGARVVAEIVSEQGARATTIHLPRGVQHLLGIVTLVDVDLALLDASKAEPELVRLLQERGYRCVMVADDEVPHQRALNLVCVAPRCVLMPNDCLRTRRYLEAAGIETHAIPIAEYRKAGGGPACFAGILSRVQPELRAQPTEEVPRD